MSYTITIKRTAVEVVPGGQEWKTIKYDENGIGVMGYTPAIDTQKAVIRDVYEQTVDTLDLVAVILAVNGLNKEQGPSVLINLMDKNNKPEGLAQ